MENQPKTEPTDSILPNPALEEFGLTKREFFASCALVGILSRSEDDSINEKVEEAVLAADTMIVELNKNEADVQITDIK
jgi:hypothetical protein